MKIQLLSDLHLETHPHYRPRPAPGADVLVLAGDIGSYQAGSMLTAQQDEDFGLARFSPRADLAAWPTPVLFVPGNHEYDGLDWDEAHQRLRRTHDGGASKDNSLPPCSAPLIFSGQGGSRSLNGEPPITK